LGKAYQCDGCGRLAPSSSEAMVGWIGLQTFELPDGQSDDNAERDFCSAFDAGAYFFRDSKIGPSELHRLLRVINQVYSPGSVSRPVYEDVKQELAHLQQQLEDWEQQGLVGDAPNETQAAR